MARHVDVLIIGGGPAGLSAAQGLSRLLYTTAIFDTGMYRNDRTHHMHNFPTWDHKDPAAFRAAVRKELQDRYSTNTWISERVDKLQKLDDGRFQATTQSGAQVVGRRVVLASGIKDIPLDIPGFDDCYGKSIYHCLFCHGYEERGVPHAGVLAVDDMGKAMVALAIGGMLQRLTDQVTLYTNGDPALAAELEPQAKVLGFLVDDRKIQSFEDQSKGEGKPTVKMNFTDGSSYATGFLAHKPLKVNNGPWTKQLDIEMTSTGNFAPKNMFGETSVPGVFAVGDCVTEAAAVITAVQTGAMAAAGIAHGLGIQALAKV